MIFKSADFVSIETNALHIEDGGPRAAVDLSDFKVTTAAGIGAGPERAFDMTLGMPDLRGISATQLSEFVGEWMAVAEYGGASEKKYLAFTDGFGYSPLFYSVIPGRAIILSDSFYGARAGLAQFGVEPTLDFENYVTTLSAKSVFFSNPSVHRTMAREVRILPLDKILFITSDEVMLFPRSILDRSSSIDDFSEAISMGVSHVVRSLNTLFSSYGGSKTLFLSGGVDSRLLLALCLEAGLKEDILIRTADPRTFPSKYSQNIIRKDVRISTKIRKDFGLEWWRPIQAKTYALDFRESLASFQSYRSNFSYTYSAQNGVGIFDEPVLALRGGGGEMLRSTNTSVQISRKIDLLVSSGEITDGSHVEKLVDWYMQTGRLVTAFDDTVGNFMTKVFGHFNAGSISEMMNIHYLNTRNRTHFGHLRFSHIGNEVAFHFLSNGFFRRAAQLCSFEERADGAVVKEIFRQTTPSLLQYPFENDEWTQKLTTGPLHAVNEDDKSWEEELDKILEIKPLNLPAPGWGRGGRGRKINYFSTRNQLSFLQQCFRLIESYAKDVDSRELRNFHQKLTSVASSQEKYLNSLVSKAASAADVFFPSIRQGKSVHLSCSISNQTAPPSIRSSHPSVLEIPQDGWNNTAFVDFDPVIFSTSEGFLISAQLCGPSSNDIEFAYYLFRDGERIDVKWYSPKPQIFFNIAPESGEYFAKIFVRNSTGVPPVLRETCRINVR